MNATSTQSEQIGDASPYPQRWLALGVLLLANFMNLIDVTIVNVALPSIQDNLAASATELEWVVAIYILAFAAGLLPFGRFGDALGRKKLFITGVIGFTLSSAACGMAPDINTLIVSRGIQGLTGAMMVPQVMAIIHVIFLPEEKGRVFGLVGLITSLGAVAGPVIAGLIIAADFGGLDWRPIFLINIPVGIIVLIGAIRWLPPLAMDERQKIDWIGALLLAAAVTLVALPLVEGHAYGWPWWFFALIAMGLVVGVIFVRWQNLRARNEQTQLLPASLLKNSRFITDIVVVAFFFSGIPSMFLVLAIFFQNGLGMTALQSGITTIPFPAGIMLASMSSGKLGNRWLTQRVGIGAFIMLTGLVYLHFSIGNSDETVTGTHFLLPLLIGGLGAGLAIVAQFQNVLINVEGKDAGAGSGAMQTFQQVGGVIGIAIIGQLFFVALGKTPETGNYIHAAGVAMWYPIVAFAVVVISQIYKIRRDK